MTAEVSEMLVVSEEYEVIEETWLLYRQAKKARVQATLVVLVDVNKT